MKDRSGFVVPLVICVFSHEGKILACRGKDDVKKNEFYRPLGGMIEFGEHSEDALKREIQEELSEEITNIKFLGRLENIFDYNGKPHHEIVMIYDAEFINKDIYAKTELDVTEDGWHKAYWLPIKECMEDKYILYPTGILDLLV